SARPGSVCSSLPLRSRGADESTVWRMSGKGFTDKQGQYLAFIDALHARPRPPPAETDMQRHFQVTPPSVHQMVLTLERAGLIRQPGVVRSIKVLLAHEDLPVFRNPRASRVRVESGGG